MIIEEGKFYRASNGDKVGPMMRWAPYLVEHPWHEDDGKNRYDIGGGIWRPDGTSDYEVPDLISEWTEEPAVFRTPTDRRIDLAVAVPLSDDILRLSLTVGGKTEQFTISRGAAASLAGRIAEALK